MSHLRLRRLAGRQLGDEKEEAATAAHNLEANACGDVRRAHCGAEGLAGGRLAASLGRRRAPGRWAGLTEVERAGGAGRGGASPQLVHDSEALLQPLRGAGTPLSWLSGVRCGARYPWRGRGALPLALPLAGCGPAAAAWRPSASRRGVSARSRRGKSQRRRRQPGSPDGATRGGTGREPRARRASAAHLGWRRPGLPPTSPRRS